MKATTRHYSFEAIGTGWTVIITASLRQTDFDQLCRAIKRRIEIFDATYSRFRADSLVSKIARSAGEYILPADAKPLLDFYQKLYRQTGGSVTPLIGQALSDAGYDAAYSLRPKELQTVPSWHEALRYNFPRLTTTQPVLLDFGAAGKGYLVDLIGELIEEYDIMDYCIDAGGDIRHRSTKNARLEVGLEHPRDPSLAIGVATLGNQSLCGSAVGKRAWGPYHHILDPRTGHSPQHIAAVWVTSESTLLADGLTTALFFTDPKKLQRQYAFEYAIVYADSSLHTSALFPATFFTQREAVVDAR